MKQRVETFGDFSVRLWILTERECWFCYAMLIDHQCYVFRGLRASVLDVKHVLTVFTHVVNMRLTEEIPSYFCMWWFTVLLNYYYLFFSP